MSKFAHYLKEFHSPKGSDETSIYDFHRQIVGELSGTGHMMKRSIDKEDESNYNKLSHTSFVPNYTKAKECLMKCCEEMNGGFYNEKCKAMVTLRKDRGSGAQLKTVHYEPPKQEEKK